MAITIRRVTGEAASRYFPSGRGSILDLTEYVNALKGLSIGDIAEVESGDATDRATKRRLTMAAKQLGMSLQWSKQLTGDGSIGFRVKGSNSPAPKRRGRPPKNASQAA